MVKGVVLVEPEMRLFTRGDRRVEIARQIDAEGASLLHVYGPGAEGMPYRFDNMIHCRTHQSKMERSILAQVDPGRVLFNRGDVEVVDAPPRNRILVIDDEPAVRRMFVRSLELDGFDVVTAADGAEGLHLLRSDDTIGLVLLDLTMPEMDGWKFRHAQQTDPRLADIPTIVVTGSALTNAIRNELGAADYLHKPIGREPLLHAASRFCAARSPSAHRDEADRHEISDEPGRVTLTPAIKVSA